ncbi:MAG: nucleotidyltransferase family protein [Clostridia bacterium]|nr:nucleotidyltransferase family protein [Clostridia bacterium]
MTALNETQTQLLSCLSAALFEKEAKWQCSDWKALFREADAHKVFPIVFEHSKACVSDEMLREKAAKYARRCLSTTIGINYAHVQLDNLMTQNGIPYICFKGIASARYYPHPELRTGGDVDFYVNEADFARCEAVLKDNGYVWVEDGGKHVVYQKDEVFLELHRTINGIPKNQIGSRIEADVFGDLVETATDYNEGQGTVKIPDTFHHGMILLLHTLSHMMKEGIGLRHLCDWMMFEASLSSEEFTALFESKLKSYGLWHFACLLSSCGNRYLGAPYRCWQGEAEDALLEKMMCDMMASGNFGKKDADRKRQIKYLAERGEFTQSERSVLAQAKRTIAKKAALEHKSQAAVMAEYIKKVLSGERKPDSGKTLESAAQRKEIYASFHLFEQDKKD